ncbi:MAG TPA: cytochrome c biogenesis protein CcdA [Anaerolineales bacterium]
MPLILVLSLVGLAGLGISTQLSSLDDRDPASGSAQLQGVHVFFSAGCADCWPYVEEDLMPALAAGGFPSQAEVHDYTVPAERTRLLQMADDLELPRSIADSLYAFIPVRDGTLVILGHVPAGLVREALAEPDLPARLVIWQPQMHGEPTEYRLWAWQGDVTTFPIDTPFGQALAQAMAAGGPLPVGLANLGELLPAVVLTGLLDSVNPCAFAVILLLIAFLFTIRQSRRRVVQLGLVYIGMIFLVYFAIGLGILRAVSFSSDPHFVARAGSWLLIGLGAINLAEYFFPRFPIKLHMPAAAGDKTNEWLKKATLPATVGVGFLVGLCTFPCSGGIYVSIITLLNAKTTLGWGVGYLALYNVLFVLPLVAILAAAGNRIAAKRWAAWEREHSRRIRLWYGLIMVALGAAMLLWLIG